MKTRTIALPVATLLLGIMSASVSADVITFSNNGHSYEIIAVEGGITWSDAQAEAEALGGYLATITSADENAFLVNNFDLLGLPYWLGGFQEPGTSEPNGDWQWVTGEAWSYTNWAGGEPNNTTGGNEDALSLAYFSSEGTWNDAPADYLYSNGGYIVEYDVPEPATLALFGLGLAGIGFSRRKKA